MILRVRHFFNGDRDLKDHETQPFLFCISVPWFLED